MLVGDSADLNPHAGAGTSASSEGRRCGFCGRHETWVGHGWAYGYGTYGTPVQVRGDPFFTQIEGVELAVGHWHLMRRRCLLFDDFPIDHSFVLVAQPPLLQKFASTANGDIRGRITYSVLNSALWSHAGRKSG